MTHTAVENLCYMLVEMRRTFCRGGAHVGAKGKNMFVRSGVGHHGMECVDILTGTGGYVGGEGVR